MKKILFGLLAAFAVVSCSKDTTTSVEYGKFEGGTLHITASILETRTALSDHKVVWAEGDTYGIYFVDASGTVLGVTESPKYETGKSDYTLENVPAGTASLYCVYPYDEDMSTDDDPSAVSVTIPTFEREDYEFNSEYNVMAAKAAVQGDSASVVFEQLVSIVELNIYDTEGDGTEQFFSATATVGESQDCAGKASVDFTADKLAVSGYIGAYTMAGSAEHSEPAIGTSKEEGVKVYLFVAKDVYEELTVSVGTNKTSWDSYYTFKFNDVDLTCDGRTFNLNLSNSNKVEYVWGLTAEHKGPWLVSAKFNVDPACMKYVIGCIQSEDVVDSAGDRDGLGYDEEKFIAAAKSALASDGYSRYLVFDVTDPSQEQTVTELYLNGGTSDEPNGLRVSPSRGYTIAVYAVDDSGNGTVYTTEFTSNDAYKAGASSVTAPTVVSKTNSTDNASATISAAGASYLFYGYSTGMSSAPTAANIQQAFVAGEGTLAPYESEVSLDFRKYGTNDYVVWAVALDSEGNVSDVASATFESTQEVVPELEYGGTAVVTDFGGWKEATLVKDLDDESWYHGVLTVPITVSADTEAFAIWDMSDTRWNADDGTSDGSGASTPNSASITLESVKAELKALVRSAKGNPLDGTLYFTKDDIKDGKISFYYTNYNEAHHLFAIALGTDGKLGPLVALAGPSTYVEGKPAGAWDVMKEMTWNFTDAGGTAEAPSSGGGDAEILPHYWKQNLTGNYQDWLKFENINITEQYPISVYFTADLDWSATADGIDDVAYIYLTKLNASKNTKESIADQLHTNFDVYNKYTPQTPESVNGTMIWKAYTDVKTVKKYELDDSLYSDDDNSAVYVMILADKDGFLTMKTAAYLTYDGSSLTPHYIDLSDADVSGF